jgi:hypothetical protein
MTLNVFNSSKPFLTIKNITLLAIFCASYSVQAGVISYNAGVDISGSSDGAYIDHNLGVYEIALLGAATQTYTRDNQEGFSVKIERDLYNIESVFHRGKTRLLGGDFNSNIATSFANEDARDTYAQRVSEKTSFDTLTQVILSGSKSSSWIDLDLETEAEQGRPSDEGFYNNLFDDTPYSQYSLDLSFDFTGSYTYDFSLINIALYESLYSFYLNSDVNTALVAVEHDMMFTLDTQSSPFYYGSVSRKLWFDNESEAISAKAFFDADIPDVYDSRVYSGWLQNDLLNNSFNFSDVQSAINQVATEDPTEVPEPSTAVLFLLAVLLLIKGKHKNLN